MAYISFSSTPPYVHISREVPESGHITFIKAKVGLKSFFIDAIDSEQLITVRRCYQ